MHVGGTKLDLDCRFIRSVLWRLRLARFRTSSILKTVRGALLGLLTEAEHVALVIAAAKELGVAVAGYS